ncbi:nucleoside-diphosphate sugar epimerase/dehydratase [Fictibacillus sp. b24]|uniref:polysaccharide biosynthesis protein n=1 Tax=Fictibacillus sp. b24 TaxID=3055863 RepID=UPI0025A2BB8C|nr:nucleoside-diphosphate sugar epimerase/dehydratase [Fictibacillus sp. b24]MDM5316428.1 nucleoside-diphosphate sugar epimerase/dehydratase [Fictibacillus sp. b24]
MYRNTSFEKGGKMKFNKKDFVSAGLYFSLIIAFVIVGMSVLGYPSEESLWIAVLYAFSITGSIFFRTVYHHLGAFKHLRDEKEMTKALLISVMLVVVVTAVSNLTGFYMVSLEQLLVGGGGAIFGLIISRFLYKVKVAPSYPLNKKGKRTLIIGAGEAGGIVLNELKKESEQSLLPVLFLDDDDSKQKLKIQSIPVLGKVDDLDWIIHKYKIEVVIIAIPSAPKKQIFRIVRLCKEHKLEVRILPLIRDIIDGKINAQSLREVKVEELLGRNPIQLNFMGILEYVKGKVVLVSGAGGSIGSEICRQVATFDPSTLILLGHGENSIYAIEKEIQQSFPRLTVHAVIADVQDFLRLKNVFSKYQPQVVFHAAAHKHVPLMEANPTEAIKNNIFGTKNMSECADQSGVERFVMISTDKAVNPTSVMGTTKRVAEMVVQNLNKTSKTEFVIVRFGNVLGSRGSVIPLFKKQILEGGPVTVTHPEMTRYFMTIPEAVQLVLQSGALAKDGDVFVLDMGEPVKIYDLAKNLITLSGLVPEKDIDIVFSGMRPGEKLYEELMTHEEESVSSKHSLIFISKSMPVDENIMVETLVELYENLYVNESIEKEDHLKQLLRKLVPTFKL